MKRDNKKALYESIMTSVAKEVKKALNSDLVNEASLTDPRTLNDNIVKYRYTFIVHHAQLLERHDAILRYANEHNVMTACIPAKYGTTVEYSDCPDIMLIGKYHDVKDVVKRFWTSSYNKSGWNDFEQNIEIIEFE